MIKKTQKYVELAVANWENTDLGSTVAEIALYFKRYENDRVEVEQLIPLGQISGKWEYFIIINHSHDLDNPGELISAPWIV